MGSSLDSSLKWSVLWKCCLDRIGIPPRPASPARSLRRLLRLLSGSRRPMPPLGLLAVLEGFCEPLLSPLSGVTLGGQFVLYGLEGLPVSFGTADGLIPRRTLVCQLGLEVTDRCLRFSQQPFRLFLCRRQ